MSFPSRNSRLYLQCVMKAFAECQSRPVANLPPVSSDGLADDKIPSTRLSSLFYASPAGETPSLRPPLFDTDATGARVSPYSGAAADELGAEIAQLAGISIRLGYR